MKTKHHQMELFLNYTLYFAIDETLTIIPGGYFKIGDTFYEFDNYDELWDKFIVFNSTK